MLTFSPKRLLQTLAEGRDAVAGRRRHPPFAWEGGAMRASVLAALVVTVSACGREEVVAPEWEVCVATAAGAPIAGVAVREDWIHHTVERRPHRDVRFTDHQGCVVFPRRTTRTSPTGRLVGAVGSFVTSSHEASLGPYAMVIIGVEGRTQGCDHLLHTEEAPLPDPTSSKCRVVGPYTVLSL